jgi:hypothetical protein
VNNSDDDDVLERMRAEFANVRLGAPIQDVVARGRRLRRWRLSALGAGAGAGTVVAVVALTFGLAAPGAQPGNATRAVLTGWSVTSGPGGTVNLTIRNLGESRHDRARVQEALRAAGVLAVVQDEPLDGCRAVAAERAVKVSREHGTVTFKIEPEKLPKRVRVTIVIPASGGSACTRALARASK